MADKKLPKDESHIRHAVLKQPESPSGDEKITEAVQPGLDARPGALDNEPSDSNAADPARGGCLKLGWGCLPLLLVVTVTPAGLLF